MDQADELAETIAVELGKIVTHAYRQFLKTLPPDTPPAAVTASGDFTPFDAIPGAWDDVVESEILPKLEGLTLKGGVSAWVRSNASADAPSGFAARWASVVNQQAVDYLKTASNRLSGVGDSIWNDIRERVSATIKTGATNATLREEIQQIAGYSEYRADLVARTETIGAYNAGNYAGSQALGSHGPVEKVWVSTLDSRTRPTHQRLHDKSKPFAQPFIVGGYPMMFPLDPSGPAKEVIQCRCYLEMLYPGDKRPDGGTVGEAVSAPPPPVTPPPPPPPTQAVVAEPGSPYGWGPRAGRSFTDAVNIPSASRGRLKERARALSDVLTKLNRLHGLPADSVGVTKVELGGKASNRLGHFSHNAKGPAPIRKRTYTRDEWNALAREYNGRTAYPEIVVGEVESIPSQMTTFTHELGHRLDWDGVGFHSDRAWVSDEGMKLYAKYKGDWGRHINEITDPEIRAFLKIGHYARQGSSMAEYTKGQSAKYYEYFTNIKEIWARSYAQWAAEATGDASMIGAIKAGQITKYQFTEAEFDLIRPYVEEVLRIRGLMR